LTMNKMAPATTVKFTTLGCRLNQAESDSMAEQLLGAGVRAAGENDDPDMVVVNTCTVTREATKASRMALRRAVRDHPGARVVAVGCYAVSDPDEIAAIDGVDLVLGNDVKERFAEELGGRPEVGPLLQIGFGTHERPPKLVDTTDRLRPGDRVRANLKVQTGCDEWCTFCIIPVTRGPLRSLDEDKVIAEAAARAAAGAREIVLTGVHLGKYRYDDGGDERDLIRLMRRLLDIEGVLRLRLSSILSNHLTSDLVQFIGAEPRVCRHLHVPLQSGDDGVLKAMHRPYGADEFVAAVERAQSAIPGLAVATDIIVGFPGESDAAFEATMDVVRRLRFSKLHVFRYSARPGTAAAEMPDVGPDQKKLRSKRLIELGNQIRTEFLRDHIGPPLDVLVEDERAVDGATVSSGQTSDYVRVWFEGSALVGEIVPVHGERVRADGLSGRLSSEAQIMSLVAHSAMKEGV
jgi:threonylcarbamoyladenosine tRNA methylthiotransferase MtaB